MNIWNKVLLGLIAVMLLPLFYFSMVALKTHEHWRTAAKKLEAKRDMLQKEIPIIKYGDPNREDPECLQSVGIELHKYLVNRGRIWRKCVFQGGFDPKTNKVVVRVDKPAPHKIAAGMVVYAFDEAPASQGGCFLGEFEVKDIIDKTQIGMVPTMRLSPQAKARLVAGKGLWTLDEILPQDARDPFVGLTREQLAAMIPAEVVDEYANDGQDGKERPLRDYHVLLKEFDRQETILIEEIATAQRHLQQMVEARDDAERQKHFRQNEIVSLKTELNRAKHERKAALAHQQSLTDELAKLEAKMAQLVKDNQRIVQEIGKMQSEMIRQVDRRTAVVAQ
ncbi:MAG: hypothetical protein JW888_09715 [Pirellulales bacterium]|nr:hypothetical protein [Pirellulales bacterium]